MQAMIFCAGLGTRFKPFTDAHPKALAMINGKSLLQRNIEYLQQFGINEVVVNVHHFGAQIIDAVTKNNGWGSRVLISNEANEVLETGGGLVKARSLFHKNQPFLTYNVDILTDADLNQFIKSHHHNDAIVSLMVSSRKTSRNFLFDADDRLCGWVNNVTGEEKLVLPKLNLVQKAYSGIAIFNYDVFDHINFSGKFSLVDVFLDIAKTRIIKGFDANVKNWIDVGKPESVPLAEKFFI